MHEKRVLREYEKRSRTVDRALPFRALQADFTGSYMLCFVGYRSTEGPISVFFPVGRPFGTQYIGKCPGSFLIGVTIVTPNYSG